MDLVTLVAACALMVDPKSLPSGLDPRVMHALIWHQSGGEPWSFSVPGERQLKVYRDMRQALREAQLSRRHVGSIRVGLTGLATDSRSASLAMFVPCANIAVAARQIAQLMDRCKTDPRFAANPIHCAIAAYRGSWEHPDTKFADAVLTSVANGDAPNFDMSDEPDGGMSDERPKTPVAAEAAPTASSVATDEQQQGWSSGLFPARSQHLRRVPTSANSNSPDADRVQETSELSAHPTITQSRAESLFVHRLPELRPQ
jgi:hypothetical protein